MNTMEGLPVAVEEHLRDVLFDRTHPLLLGFDAAGELRDVRGDASFYGIDPASPDEALGEIHDLFVGLPPDTGENLPFVELANGRSVHVHRIPVADGFYVLLLDADETRNRERMHQQVSHEAALAGYQKTRAISLLKDVRDQLERQRAGLEEANALKNALISTMGHEFRTPLTSIFGYLDALDTASVDAQTALPAIRRNATHLYALAENLLEYGRGEAGSAPLEPAPVDLERLRADMDAMFQPLAGSKGVEFAATLSLHGAGTPWFDEIRVRQVVINLLSNAVRYTSRGRISLGLDWDGAMLRIEVRDSGIGISPEFQASVFTPFNRGAQAGSVGAGLGLSIVRRLVERMHGTLALESVAGQGTTFRIAIPSAPAPDSAAAVHERALRVLVVDDDPDIVELLRAVLEGDGCHVMTLSDAGSAIEEAMRSPPDVLVIDVEMPGMSGNAAVFRLRSQGYRGRIVVLSANAGAEARDAALRAGADRYMTKPLNLDRLRATVAELAAGKR